MGQRSNYVVVRDVQKLLKEVECVEDIEQSINHRAGCTNQSKRSAGWRHVAQKYAAVKNEQISKV